MQVRLERVSLTVPSLAENRSLMFAFTSLVPDTWERSTRRAEATRRQKEGQRAAVTRDGMALHACAAVAVQAWPAQGNGLQYSSAMREDERRKNT